MPSVKRRPRIVDLFSGCGGLSIGFSESGYNPVLAVENNHVAAATFKQNLPDTQVLQIDIRDALRRLLSGDSQFLGLRDIDVVCGGPPCQGFSEFNRFRSIGDERNELVSYFLEFAFQLEPRAILIENVPGILSIDGGSTPRAILQALERNGYTPHLYVLQAGGYGVPQSRWRLFIVAFKGSEVAFEAPIPTHTFPRMPLWGAKDWRSSIVNPPERNDLVTALAAPVTVGDAIRDLPPLENGQFTSEVPYLLPASTEFQRYCRRSGSQTVTSHGTKNLGALQLERVRNVPKRPMAGWWDLPEDLKPLNLVRHGDKRYENRFGRLWWDGIFNTILTDAHLYWSRVIHPEQDRIISVRESARAQSFADDFVFTGKPGEQYRQVGNAVPPLLARSLALAMRAHLP